MSMQSFGLIDMQLRLDPDAHILYVVVGHSGNMALETRDLDERRAVDYDLAGDIVEIKLTHFRRHLGMEYDVEQEVTEFLSEVGIVMTVDGLQELADFLD